MPESAAALSAAELRHELEQLIVGDLLGPASGPEETLPGRGSIRDRYLVGKLAPAATIALDPARVEATGSAGDPAPGDEPTPDDPAAKAALFPSSMGLTFVVSCDEQALSVTAQWGRYHKEPAPEGSEGTGPTIWRREPVEGKVTLALEEGDLDVKHPCSEQPEVVVRGRARRIGDCWLVSIFLVNGQGAPKLNKDEAWLFQAGLEITATVPDTPIFCGRAELAGLATAIGPASEELESRLLDLQYRNTVEFAVGHGVAVHADLGVDRTRAIRLATRVIPIHDVPITEAPGADDPTLPPAAAQALGRAEFDMEVLARTADDQLADALRPLVEAYEAWLDEQDRRVAGGLDGIEQHRSAATQALADARRVATRLRAGISLVAADPLASEAFRFANEAMWHQRVHTLAAVVRRNDPTVGPDEAQARFSAPRYHSWRPFQLAFVLLNLPALTNPAHTDRSTDVGIVDLLFFPTGGGKTEAYLGLAAFTLAIRRLQGVVDTDAGPLDGRSGGVAVLMRYTLRLLTAQQFQRAAALMCACEVGRRARVAAGDERWGDTPFRLGMWVGSGVTPNRSGDAATALERSRLGGRGGGRSTPVQLVACPWCGTAIDPAQHARPDNDRWRTLVFCGDPFGTCPFTEAGSPHEGLPVVTVDDELYRLLPSFVIATADKFAQLPWQGPLHLLFGRVRTRCERHGYRSADLDRVGERTEADRHPAKGALPPAVTMQVTPLRPPDLIIQDELHLIAGPLGTLVGLYETAVDELASWSLNGQVVRPKIVASTATVRRAPEQAWALFARKLEVFPPPVLDVEDSFFAKQRPPSPDRPGRRYIGICAHGQRLKSVEVRVFTTLLAAAQKLYERHGPDADPWMTLIGYFNALRELGGAKRLIDDDVKARLRKTDRRGLATRKGLIVEELTSRIASTDIPAVLDQLAVGVDRAEGGPRSIDVLLATSMISVGVDVARLGFLTAIGQPKATAEYIQATSRVGRDAKGPGLVVTVYNWARPRDLSHYETFEHYHATFYRHVEALSVTPFSPRALDRGLTAVLVALIRHRTRTAWNPNGGAQAVDVTDADVTAVIDAIVARAGRVATTADAVDTVRDMLADRLDRWRREETVVGAVLGYRQTNDGKTRGLLRPAELAAWTDWTCPGSLRETEPTVNLQITAERIDPSLDNAPPFALGAGVPATVEDTAEDDEDAVAIGVDG